MKTGRRFQLKDSDQHQRRRFLSGSPVSLGETRKSSTETFLRIGSFYHPVHGRFEVTKELFDGFLDNFNKRTYGQDIQLDVMHDNTSANAVVAGTITKLFVDGNRLRGTVEWSPEGIRAVKDRGLKYLSADYWDNYIDNEDQAEHGPLFAGAGLVPRPHIKNMDPVSLKESDDDSILLIHPKFAKQLIEEAQKTMNKHLKLLLASLVAMKLNEDTQKKLGDTFEAQAKNLGDDDKSLKTLRLSFEDLGKDIVKQLKDAGKPADEAVTLNINLAEPADSKQLSVADEVAKVLKENAAAAKKLEEKTNTTLVAKKKIFNDALDAAEGLSDETKKSLTESVKGLIGINLSDSQIKTLAETQIALGNQMEASKQLSDMGYQVIGSTHIAVGGSHAPMKLQETINKHLGNTSESHNQRLKLLADDKVGGFVKQVMAQFDAIHGARLLAENKVLAGEETSIGDTSLPVGVQRTVIREALSDLRILELVQTLTDATATATTQIPYEERDISAVQNHAITFEGKGIRGASIRQKMDLAYIIPKKLAMKLSNEVIHFTRASAINWDAFARNVTSNARVMREMLAGLIANEIQRTSDSWNAGSVAGEDISARLDGSNAFVKTAQWPVVRPHQDYDLQGSVIGSVQNPITVMFGATEILAFDGSGDQSAGVYYSLMSLNLGYIGFVDQTGTPVTPTEATATISYDYSKNVVKWDSDVPSGVTYEKHLNKLLQVVGARKAMMSQDRFVSPEYLLMSPTLNDTLTNAEQFEKSHNKNGAALSGAGDLQTIKAIPSFGTNAPGIDLGDDRIHMGVRGTTSYVVAKPFMTGVPFEAVDTTGKPTGEKVAYGEEYSAIHTPKPIRNRSTGVIVYSLSARNAA